jgi:hypothetical protein
LAKVRELNRFLDGEAVSDVVDEEERLAGWDEENGQISGASPSIEEEMKWGYHHGWILAGGGSQGNEWCGTWGKIRGCKHTELHHGTVFDEAGKLIDVENKGYFENGVHCCERWTCPKCYRRRAYRAAVRAEERLAEVAKRYGLIEHFMFSVPHYLHEEAASHPEKIRGMVIKMALKLGVLGGPIIFHGFRYNVTDRWYWSPHFHVLSPLLHGFKCRSCPNVDYASKSVCGACDGFEAAVRRINEGNGVGAGWIIKVARDRVTGKADVRRSIRKTISYELAHASIKLGSRASVVTYFGVASCRKLKVEPKKLKKLCPLCHNELVEYVYVGDNIDVLRRIRWGVGGSFYEVLTDGKGLSNFEEPARDRFGRPIYVRREILV